jgi:glycosyltransferase involved in cell wall biosynthesis
MTAGSKLWATDNMARIIKPLFVISDLQGGGAERVVLSVLRRLDRSRFRPTLFLFKHTGVYWREVPDHVRVIWALESGRLRNAALSVLAKLVREARQHDIVVGALELTPTYLAWLTGLIARRPVIGWVHTDLPEYVARSGPWHGLAARLVYRRLHSVVFVSRGAMKAAAKFFRQEPGPSWRTIYNPFDPESYRPYRRVSAEPGVSGSEARGWPTVLGMGRLSEEKGFDVLIRAHVRLLREGVCHRVVILGEGRERRRLETLIDELGVRDTVSLPGFVSDPLHYMSQSSVFVLSSRFEGFSLVVLEALAMGLPVVSTDCPSGPAEILDGGRYGLLVPVDDEEALAGAIKRLLCDPHLRSRLSSAGIVRARHFSPERAAAEWEALLLSVCSRSTGKPGDAIVHDESSTGAAR